MPLQVILYHQKDVENKIKLYFTNKKYDFIIFHLIRSIKYQHIFKSNTKYLDNSDSLILNYKNFIEKQNIKFFLTFFN